MSNITSPSLPVMEIYRLWRKFAPLPPPQKTSRLVEPRGSWGFQKSTEY
jgi:hypothetical protein